MIWFNYLIVEECMYYFQTNIEYTTVSADIASLFFSLSLEGDITVKTNLTEDVNPERPFYEVFMLQCVLNINFNTMSY